MTVTGLRGLMGLALLLLLVGLPRSLPAQPVELHAISRSLPLTHQALRLVDETRTLTIDDIIQQAFSFQQNDDDAINFGYIRGSAWVRFEARNSSNRSGQWWLEIDYPSLHSADLYVVRGDHTIDHLSAGLAVPLAEWPHLGRTPVFPVRMEAGESAQFFLRIERPGGNVRAPLTLWTPQAFSEHETRVNYLLGSYLGVMLAMIAYNLFLFVRMRMSFQWHYLLTVTAVTLNVVMLSGFGRILLPWITVRFIDDVLIAGGALVLAFGIQFGRRFIDVRHINANLDLTLNVTSMVGLAIALLQISGSGELGQMVVIYTGLSSPLLLLAGLYCWMKGSRTAVFFVIGWSVALCGSTLYALMMHDLVPVTFVSQYAILIGSAVEIILLSLGIADYFDQQRKSHTSSLEEQNATLLRLKEAEQQLMHRALHSGTTGLPNRSLLRECMRGLIEQRNMDPRFCLLLVNFRNFHEFNKTLGHQNGDEILRMMSTRLAEHVRLNPYSTSIEHTTRGNPCLATVEGVTFGFLLRNASVSDAREFADELVRRMEQPFMYQDMSLNLQVSLGIAHYPFHGDSPEQLLRNAQIALEVAGEDVEQVCTYDVEKDPYSARRLTLLGELRLAIANDELDLHLQPQLNLATQRVTAAEVLLRWNHPRHGYIPPDQFIPLAERTGVIQALTQWVFRRAFSYLDELNARGYHLNLSINISARNLQDPAFQERALQLARDYRIAPSQVILELTETAMLLNEERGNNTLYQLDSAGFGIAIDDFGTGFSSLSHLKRIPVQEIKIDRGFIRDMTQRVDDQIIVTTTLQMGHNLGLRVVAEGVEDATTLEFLRKAGCDLAQGYHIARPMPFPAFLAWLEQDAARQKTGT